jgi:hypothetical protein
VDALLYALVIDWNIIQLDTHTTLEPSITHLITRTASPSYVSRLSVRIVNSPLTTPHPSTRLTHMTNTLTFHPSVNQHLLQPSRLQLR